MRPTTAVVLALTIALSGAHLHAQPAAEAQQHADEAVRLAQRGDLKNAESELHKAIELSPDDATLLTSLGGILGMEGNLQEANSYLARAVKLNPQDPASRRNLAANQWQLGRLKEAHENLDLLLRTNPSDQVAIYLLGMVLEKQKAYARSAKLLESVPEVVAHQPDGWVALGDSYYHSGRPQNARAALQHLLTASQDSRAAFLGGRVAADAKDYPTAENLFRSVRSSYPDRAALEFQIARVEYQARHVAESEKTLLDAVNANYATSDGYVLLCTLLSADGSDIRALQVATQANQRFPESSELLSVKGSIELKLRYYTDAATSYEKSTKLKDSAAARRGLGTAQWGAGLHERAISTFEQAMRQFPRDAAAYQVYGTLLLQGGAPENKARAVDLLKRALALDDAAVEPRYQLANLELADGNTEQARIYLERAIELDPNDSRLHFVLGRVYRRLGRETDAGRETEIYQKLNAAKQAGTQKDTPGGTHP